MRLHMLIQARATDATAHAATAMDVNADAAIFACVCLWIRPELRMRLQLWLRILMQLEGCLCGYRCSSKFGCGCGWDAATFACVWIGMDAATDAARAMAMDIDATRGMCMWLPMQLLIWMWISHHRH